LKLHLDTMALNLKYFTMAIKKILLICLLICGALALHGQKNTGNKKIIKKPAVTKPVTPVVQTLKFTLSERCDYGTEVLYTGEVKDGKANGYGKAFIGLFEVRDTTKDHLGVYKGYWKDNAFHGKGDLRGNFDGFSSGKTQYIGEFENGKYHGEGKLWPMYNTYKEGRFIKGVYVEGSAPAPVVKKDEPTKVSPAKEPALKSKPTRPPDEMFYAMDADFANIDWDALGRRKEEPGYTTGAKIAFLEEVSKDVRKYLNETYTYNGSTYKRYSRSREVEGNYSVYSGQDVQLNGKKTPVIILTYCQNFAYEAKAKVSINYDGNGRKTDNTVLTGATCNVVTDCYSRICKTTCNGAIEVESGSSKTLWLMREGKWNGLERIYWVVLADLQR
jgi:hypothetical protein